MKSIKFIILITIIIFNLISSISACTTAIVSGKATPDGRPLLWKHRDSDFHQNKLMYFKGDKYNFIGLVNSIDTTGKKIWAGTNSAGFCIMNSASYNLKEKSDTTKIMDREGILMKEALQQCATVNEFENFLKDYLKPLRVEANFGVIDAKGNGAYFETCNFSYTKFDVNDPIVAPHGYILRTNYSYTGKKDGGWGFIRYETARQNFEQADAMGKIDLDFILSTTRSIKHSLTKIDYSENLPENNITPHFVFFEDMIARYSSTSTIIFQGVKKNENPELTTMWTVLGFQFCSVAVPTWVEGGENLPEIMSANEKEIAPLCDMALKLKEKCFPVKRGSGKKYLNLAAVINKEKNGIYQKLQPVEKHILNTTKVKMQKWRKNGIKKSDIQKYYNWVDKFVENRYQELFGL